MKISVTPEYGYVIKGEGINRLSIAQIEVALGQLGVGDDVSVGYADISEKYEFHDEPEVSPTDPRYIAYTDLCLYTTQNREKINGIIGPDYDSDITNDMWQMLFQMEKKWAERTVDVMSSEGEETGLIAVDKNGNIHEAVRWVDRDYTGMHGKYARVHRVAALNLFTTQKMLDHFNALPETEKSQIDWGYYAQTSETVISVLNQYVADKIAESRELSLPPL